MSTTLAQPSDNDVRPSGFQKFRWLKLGLVGGAAAALAAVIALNVDGDAHAHALSSGVGGETFGPATVGHTTYTLHMVETQSDRPQRLDLRHVRPIITTNTAHATVRVLLCTRNAALEANLAAHPDWCSSTEAFTPGKQTLRGAIGEPGTTMIILAITPEHAGRIVIHGVHVDYRDGDTRGSQTTGVDITLNARAS